MKEFARTRQRLLGKFGAGRQHGLVAAERERRRAQREQGNDERQPRDPCRPDAAIGSCRTMVSGAGCQNIPSHCAKTPLSQMHMRCRASEDVTEVTVSCRQDQ
ncbi:hypothetical protein [Bradyrhizobium elkanii]